MSGFTLETARGQSPAPLDILQLLFSGVPADESGSCNNDKANSDALFMDAAGTRVFGICGLQY